MPRPDPVVAPSMLRYKISPAPKNSPNSPEHLPSGERLVYRYLIIQEARMTTRPPGIPPFHRLSTYVGPRSHGPISRHAAPKRPPNRHSAAPNKPNFPRFWPENADRARKQTQSNPIAPGVLSAIEWIYPGLGFISRHPATPGPAAPNKANYRRSWLENASCPEKQTQSKPIAEGVLSAVEWIYPARPGRLPFFHLALERPGLAAIMARPRQAVEINFLLGEVSKWQMHRRATQS